MKKHKTLAKRNSTKSIFYLFHKIFTKSTIILILFFFIFFQAFAEALIYSSPDSNWGGETVGAFSDPYLYFTFIAPVFYSLMICPFIYRSISKSVFSNRLGSTNLTKSNFIFTIWCLFFLSSLLFWLIVLVPTGLSVLFFAGWPSFSFGLFIKVILMSIFFIGLLTSVAVFMGSLPISRVGLILIGAILATMTMIINFTPEGIWDGFGPSEERVAFLWIWWILIIINPLSPFMGLLRFFPESIGQISWYWYYIEIFISIILSGLLIFGSIKIHRW